MVTATNPQLCGRLTAMYGSPAICGTAIHVNRSSAMCGRRDVRCLLWRSNAKNGDGETCNAMKYAVGLERFMHF